jgi:type I restriction enzyme S subunit
MRELRYAPLSEFADVTMGQSPGAELCNHEEKGLPFLQGCGEFGARHPETQIYCSPPLRVAKKNSVLISVRAPVGTMNYADQDYCVGRGLGSFKAKPGLSNSVFLRHAVEQSAGYLHRRSQGSTFAAVSTADVRNIPVPAFSPKIQNKIAAIFTSIDTAIDKTEALIAKHQQIKAGLMHDLFTRGVLPNGQLRPARSEAPELYRKTAVGWIPRNWQPLTLRELVGAGSIVNGPFGSDLLTHELRAEGIPVLYVQDIKPGAFTRVSNAHVTAQKANELAFCNVRRGDVLVAKVGGPPCDSCVYEDNLTAIVTQDVIRIRPSGEVDSVYLGALLNSSYGRKVIKKISIEGTRERVSLTEFKGLAFPIAQPDEQKHIAQWVVQMQAAITAERDKVEKLQKQKRGLMQDLLTGKVPVPINPDPADTTA